MADTVRTLISATDPVFMNAEQTSIRVNAVFEELISLGPIPFVAMPNDPVAHGGEIYDRAMAGEFGPVGPYVENTTEQFQAAMKAARDAARDKAPPP